MFDITDQDIEHAPKISKSMGNCTVVSLMPLPLMETKPQIMPGYFQIPPAKYGDLQVLQVGESIHWMDSPFHGMPAVKLTEPPKAIAKSIVNDFIEGQLGTDTDTAPGLFWVEGHWSAQEIKERYPELVANAKARQDRWFVNLIRLADDDWEQNHQHRMISDIQRRAAKSLGMAREWINVALDAAMLQCPMCKELVRPDAVVHASCGYILKPKEHAEMMNPKKKKEALPEEFLEVK